jgi:hypothetical protein
MPDETPPISSIEAILESELAAIDEQRRALLDGLVVAEEVIDEAQVGGEETKKPKRSGGVVHLRDGGQAQTRLRSLCGVESQ